MFKKVLSIKLVKISNKNVVALLFLSAITSVSAYSQSQPPLPKSGGSVEATPSHSVVPLSAEDSKKPEKMKQRLEQLFMWRVSDRLQLSTSEEMHFEVEYKKISEEKRILRGRSDEVAAQLDQRKADKKLSTKLMQEYLDVMKKLNGLPSKEILMVEKLFGSSKAAEYVLLKREMMKKFKDMLSQDHSQAATAE